MKTINDFFIPENKVEDVSEDSYKQIVPVLINSVEAVARLTYQSIYVIDYFKKNFLYVSDNLFFLCGLQPDEVREMGFSFYFNLVPKDEMNMLLEINRAGFSFYNEFSIEERLKLFITYDFHVCEKDHKILINHKLTPILLAENGHIWLAVCVVSLSSNQEKGNVEAHLGRRLDYWTYSLESHQWQKEDSIVLTGREKEVLLYSAQGFTEEKMAKKMNLAPMTIKFHKQTMFNKMNVNNITAAIATASHKKMI